MSDHYDALETRDPGEREAALMAALPVQVAHAKDATDWYAKSLAEVDPASVSSREALAALPVTRKHGLIEAQREAPPLAGLNALDLGRRRRGLHLAGADFRGHGHARGLLRRRPVPLRCRAAQGRHRPEFLLLPSHTRRLDLP